MVHRQSPQYLVLLGLWYKLKSYEAEALSVDHLAPEKWDVDGGKLWHKIQNIHIKIMEMIDD